MASSGGKLSELQIRVLEALAGIRPQFVLGGGAALVGVHLGHRETRDLDLFWRNQQQLADVPRLVTELLATHGFSASLLQTSPTFVRIHVVDGDSAAIIDLIAEPGEAIDAPEPHLIGQAEVIVDSRRAILAEKLCALLSRSELRDLIDVEALVRQGGDLGQAIADAPRRDSGFSPLTLAWVLRDFDVRGLALSAGMDAAASDQVATFRQTLIGLLIDQNRA